MKHYSAPKLVEYGRLERLTLGQHGDQPDYNVNGGTLANNDCLPQSTGPGESGNSSPFVCGSPTGTPGVSS
jgi:hypothetical protein